MKLTCATLSAVFALVCTTTLARGGEWPRYLGPAGTGVVEAGERIARSWPAGGPKELWSIKVGEGYGGASIAGGKVYLLDRRDNKQDIFRVLDLKTGETVWEYSYDTLPLKASHPGSRGTPTIDGDRAYTVGLMGQVHCFDVPAKKVVWSKSLYDDFGADRVPWGFAQSPLVVRDMVVMAAPSKATGVIAVDKLTGETRWKSKPFGGCDTYISPMLLTIAGHEQIVNWHRGALAGIDPGDGELLWTHVWRTNRPVPQPVAMGDGRFFLTIGYGGGCAMIQVARAADGTWSTSEIFQDTRSGSRVPPALLYQGHIYTNSGDNRRGLQCLDANGDVKWETVNKPQFGQGSMIIADGMIFIVNDETGELVMAEASPNGYTELARAKVLGGREIWGPMALSDGHLVLRDMSQMKCLFVGAAGEAGAGAGE